MKRKNRYEAKYFLSFWGVLDHQTGNVSPEKSKDEAKAKAKELNEQQRKLP